MAKISPKNVVIPTIVLLVICIVISGALAYTNSITKDKIAQIDRENSISAMKEIFSEKGAEFTEKTVKGDNGNEYTYSVVKKDNAVFGYVFTTSENGYGGKVSVMTGITADGSVKSIKVLGVDDETPGLGQTAKTNEKFTAQFSGKSGEISTEKNKDVDALTGATITTNAVIKDVNTALNLYSKVKGGE